MYVLYEVHSITVLSQIHARDPPPQKKFKIKTYELYAIPVQAWTGPEGSRGCGSQISRQSAHEGG